MNRAAPALALGFGAAYVALGLAVAHAAPGALDRAGAGLTGQAPLLALVFTASCWWPALAAFAGFALLLAWQRPAWRGRVAFSILTTLVAWQTSDLAKALFARPRPAYWVLVHETSAAYSSGHAMFALVVYGLWSWYVARSGLPAALRRPLAALLALWALGILWSRLALGAHYATDLLGGLLLGAALLAAAATLAAAFWHNARATTAR